MSKAALTLHFERGEARAEFSRLGDSRCPNLVLQADNIYIKAVAFALLRRPHVLTNP